MARGGDAGLRPTESDESLPGIQVDSTEGLRPGADETLDIGVALRGEEARPGRVIAGRYRLVERLGAGAHGEVWTVDDLVLGAPAALKWISHGAGHMRARIQREITTLRMLHVPGVVRLLDDGVEDGRPFLVMERVEGTPFPGSAALHGGVRPRWSWAALADPTLALLEVLGRVHGAGIVHRDLKPDNILVSVEGRPTVLDFGISHWRDQTGRLTEAGHILGTPLYLAPEQILGRMVDGRSDLYTVGVMLYEALTGHVPHEARDVQSLLRARLVEPALPVQQMAPDLPAALAEVIDRLLALRMEERFQSATEVLAALRGQSAAARTGPALPLLGDGSALRAVLAAVRAGRSIDVVGPPGSGRSRCLGDAAEALARAGRTVAWARPARAPLASLQPVVGALDEDDGLRLADVMTRMEAGLRATLTTGVVVLVDDAEQLDPWSAAVLARVDKEPRSPVGSSGGAPGWEPMAGVIVQALPGAPPGMQAEHVALLQPLSEMALRPLFAGPDRLFHLREDAARALWDRTGGLPARVEAEVTLWTRLGLARWDGGLLVVDRETLGRLGADLPGATPASAPSAGLDREPHLQELLRWLALGGHHLELTQLAQAMRQPAWKLEAGCEALVARGLARWLSGTRIAPRAQVDIRWSASRRREVHRSIAQALRPGQEGRLFHLLAAEDVREATAEAVEVAQRRGQEGDLGAASTALAEGLRAVRQREDPAADDEVRLLAVWVKIAFAEGTPLALDRVLYELSRARCRGSEVQRLDALVRAGIAAPGASGVRAREQADGIPPFDDVELERWRQRVRVVAAATRWSPALLEEVLVEVRAWATRSGELLAQLILIEGQALLRYIEGRFEEAAVLRAAMAEQEPWLTGRIAAILNSASALLEAFRHREAAERAAAAMALAARCRHPYWEARAEWLLRSTRYRMKEAAAPDLELVEAVERLGVQELEGLVYLNEAAVAFRAGEAILAAELAGRAAAAWRRIDRAWGELLAQCLALACGAAAEAAEVEMLAERAAGCPLPWIGVQALGLLGRASPEASRRWRDAAERLAEGIPRASWDQRLDVLSVEEALDGVLRAAAAEG